MLRNLRQFNQKLQEFSKDVLPRTFRMMQRKVAMDILRGVVKKTPVDTGRARGNWLASVGNSITVAIKGSVRMLKSGVTRWSGEETPLQKAVGALQQLKFGQTIFITNNVPYILYLEEGTPRMKAHKMLDLTIKEVTSELE
jgi:hypothetical protein